MKVVTHRCPNCNANLKLKSDVKSGVCEYCNASFTIDDEVIRVEHTGVLEIKDDNDLEIAITTLDNFKDYRKSEFLFKSLLNRYAHKKDIYIYLIRSITHDFKKNKYSESLLNEINEFWEKYKSLAEDVEIDQYLDSINEINKKYWYSELIELTDKFNYKRCKTRLKEIEYSWENYIKYCDSSEKIKLQVKYDEFIKNRKNEIDKNLRMFKLIIGFLLVMALIVFVIDFLSLLFEKVTSKVKDINLSEITTICDSFDDCGNYDEYKKYFNDVKSDFSIDKVYINKNEKKLNINIVLKNRYITTNQFFEFTLNDDIGPFITQKECSFKDTEDVDLFNCFEAYDFSDGIVGKDSVEFSYDNNLFESEGIKEVLISARDNEGNTSSKNIEIVITKTPIELDVNLSQPLIVGGVSKLIYNFVPNNILNKEVEISYDKNYLEIDSNNNVRGLKKGNTDICVISKYDGTKKCIKVDIPLKCQNTYNFSFSGGSNGRVIADEHFCTGTYKIYASVLNSEDIYTLYVEPEGNLTSRISITIAKFSDFLSDEGQVVVFEKGTAITVPLGVTNVKLIKK